MELPKPCNKANHCAVLDIPTATLILGFATLVLSAVIACVTSYIAIQQWLTARSEVRLHLFDRRISVYDAVMELTRRIVKTPPATPQEIKEITDKTRVASFIFNDKIQAYCDDLREKAIEVVTTPDVPRKQFLEKWFVDQREKEIKKRFGRLLRICE